MNTPPPSADWNPHTLAFKPNSFSLETWYHIAAVYNGYDSGSNPYSSVGINNNSKYLYVDGILNSSATDISSLYSIKRLTSSRDIAGNKVTLGNAVDSTFRDFHGEMDEFMFFNKPLTQSEIKGVMMGSPPM
jgi:hypothetical protein